MSLDEYLQQNNIVGIEGIDTRALTRKLRISGAMRGVLSTEILDDAKLVDRAKHAAQMDGADWVQGGQARRRATRGTKTRATGASGKVERGDGLHVVALDCGAKHNILRHLTERGVKVTVLPPDTTADEILKHKPDGLFVSNGPGDPAAARLRRQAASKARSAKSRSSASASATSSSAGPSAPRPTSSNSATAAATSRSRTSTPAASKSPAKTTASPSTQNPSKRTAASSRTSTSTTTPSKASATSTLPVFSVQYHPEASPGPHDATYLFDAFIEMMKTKKAPTGKRLAELQSLRNRAERFIPVRDLQNLSIDLWAEEHILYPSLPGSRGNAVADNLCSTSVHLGIQAST